MLLVELLVREVMNFVLGHFGYQLEQEPDGYRLAIREHIAFVKLSCSFKVGLSKMDDVDLIASEGEGLSARVMFRCRLV